MGILNKTKPFSAIFVKDNKSNEALMEDFIKGDEGAFKVLYENYKNPIYSFIFGMVKSEHQASELAQDVFIKLYKNKDKFNLEQKFTTWLWSIARNTTIDFLRKKDPLRYPAHITLEEGSEVNQVEYLASDNPGQEELLASKSEKEAIESCMSSLKSNQEEALRLRILSELSYEEISQTMSLSLAAVKSLLNRAKKSLLTCLKGYLHE